METPGHSPGRSRRDSAQELAEELLSDFELQRLTPQDLVRKAGRLARLLDDHEAVQWLRFEVEGYAQGQALDTAAWAAARRSGRITRNADGNETANVTGVGQLATEIEAGLAQIAAAADAPRSVASANPNQFVMTPGGNTLLDWA